MQSWQPFDLKSDVLQLHYDCIAAAGMLCARDVQSRGRGGSNCVVSWSLIILEAGCFNLSLEAKTGFIFILSWNSSRSSVGKAEQQVIR
jgi:hypothetical protein